MTLNFREFNDIKENISLKTVQMVAVISLVSSPGGFCADWRLWWPLSAWLQGLRGDCGHILRADLSSGQAAGQRGESMAQKTSKSVHLQKGYFCKWGQGQEWNLWGALAWIRSSSLKNIAICNLTNQQSFIIKSFWWIDLESCQNIKNWVCY